MIVDFILLNLMALCGTGGVAAFVGMAFGPAAGIAVVVAGLAFANWAWWDVYFRMDGRHRRPRS